MTLKITHITTLLLAMFFALNPQFLNAQDNKKTSENYTIKHIGMTSNDDYLVEVTAEGKTIAEAQKNIVFYAVQSTMPESATINVNEQYIKNILLNDENKKYAELLNHDNHAPVKTKKGFRVTKTVIVHKDALRRKLETDGIIRALSSPLDK